MTSSSSPVSVGMKEACKSRVRRPRSSPQLGWSSCTCGAVTLTTSPTPVPWVIAKAPLVFAFAVGGAGTISATANLFQAEAQAVHRAWRAGDAAEAERLQARLTALRQAFQVFPPIPAIKAVLARRHGDPGWTRTRLPFQPLDRARTEQALAVAESGAAAA